MTETEHDTEQWKDATDTDANPIEDEEWQEVEAEVMIKLETQGDGFYGRFQGMDPPNANGIVQAHFTGVTDLTHMPLADTAFMNATRDLIPKLKKVPYRAMVRLQWTDSMDTGHVSGTPMRVHSVKWK